jgi:VanZ family protein
VSAFGSRAARFGRYWLPVLAWAAAIFIGSGDPLSSASTSRFLEPFIQWVLPRLPREAVEAVMVVIRKGGHLTEYAILAVLCWRAVRQMRREGSRGWEWRDAGTTMAMAVVYAASDEFHQAFVPSRTASPWDVLVDACGAAAGLALVWSVGRIAKGRRPSPAL